MEDKSLYELGILAQRGNDMAMLEIINRKKNMIRRYSYRDEDTYQYIILKLIEGIKRYEFKKWKKLKIRVTFWKIPPSIIIEGQL